MKMKKEVVINYIDIAMDIVYENEKDAFILSMWEDIRESYQNESFDYGLDILSLDDEITAARKIIKEEGQFRVECSDKELRKGIKKAWKQFLNEYSNKKMNNSDELNEFSDIIENTSKKDLRIGQAIYVAMKDSKTDLFNISNSKLIKLLRGV